MKVQRLGKGPRVFAEVLALLGDNVLMRASWRHREQDMVNHTVVSKGYFKRRYGLDPEAVTA